MLPGTAHTDVGRGRVLFLILLWLVPAISWTSATARLRQRWSVQRWSSSSRDEYISPQSYELEAQETVKRKVVLVCGFNGTSFFGSQIMLGPDALPTIEGKIWEALVRAGLVLSQNAEDPAKVAFGSSSRCDRGVSAARFCLSVKLEAPSEPPAFDAAGRSEIIREHLNAELPEAIRCFAVCRVTKKFRPRHLCNW